MHSTHQERKETKKGMSLEEEEEEEEEERTRKPLCYNDCSLGSVKTCLTTTCV